MLHISSYNFLCLLVLYRTNLDSSTAKKNKMVKEIKSEIYRCPQFSFPQDTFNNK